MPRTTSVGGIDYMALGLAARPLIHSTDAAPAAFATLVGPVVAPGRRPPKNERDLLATVAHELRNPLASLRLSLVLVSLFPNMMTAVASSFRSHLPFVVLR